MIESSDVMSMMKLVYMIYLSIVISLFGIYVWSITMRGNIRPQIKVPFYGWLGLLVFTGIGIHVLSFHALPWVKWDLTRNGLKTEKEYTIVAANHAFQLPAERLTIDEGQMVRFNVESRDYTYGFGLFRSDGSMVFQMQVVPGSTNDIVWKFDKAGAYTIRSTEYSGPRGGRMVCRNAVIVASATAIAQAKADI